MADGRWLSCCWGGDDDREHEATGSSTQMIGGATRGLFRSVRQMRRAAARQAQKQKQQPTGARGRSGDSGRTMCGLAREESVINQQKHAFGRAQYAETMPRIMSVGAVGMLDVGAIDALNLSLADMAAEDDDGR